MVYRFKEQTEKNKTKQQNNETRTFRFHEFNNFANVLKRFNSFRNVPAVQLVQAFYQDSGSSVYASWVAQMQW